MLKAVERGYVQQEIQNAAYEYQRAVENGEATVVGVNRFAQDAGKAVPIQRIDESLERKQVDRVCALRSRRDPGPWKQPMNAIEVAARSADNLMPRILPAVQPSAPV